MANTRISSFHLLYDKTDSSPFILLDINKEILEITGRAYSDTSTKIINNLADKIKELKPNKLNVTIKIDYVNSSSTKALYNLFDSIQNNVDVCEIHWITYVDDVDSIELGNMFKDAFKLNFIFETYY